MTKKYSREKAIKELYNYLQHLQVKAVMLDPGYNLNTFNDVLSKMRKDFEKELKDLAKYDLTCSHMDFIPGTNSMMHMLQNTDEDGYVECNLCNSTFPGLHLVPLNTNEVKDKSKELLDDIIPPLNDEYYNVINVLVAMYISTIEEYNIQKGYFTKCNSKINALSNKGSRARELFKSMSRRRKE